MPFQADLDVVRTKTGHDPAGLKKAGAFAPDISATPLCAWLAQEVDLGRGHSMALWAVFKSKGGAAAAGRAPKKS